MQFAYLMVRVLDVRLVVRPHCSCGSRGAGSLRWARIRVLLRCC